MSNFNRRDFLKLLALSATGLALPPPVVNGLDRLSGVRPLRKVAEVTRLSSGELQIRRVGNERDEQGSTFTVFQVDTKPGLNWSWEKKVDDGKGQTVVFYRQSLEPTTMAFTGNVVSGSIYSSFRNGLNGADGMRREVVDRIIVPAVVWSGRKVMDGGDLSAMNEKDIANFLACQLPKLRNLPVCPSGSGDRQT